ncbi:hypothetical protein DFJ77DRAFT_481487 [Powellomyces hirtus]|nr:hypothetical protein DFJ77DRAFT_481487 [Powellomyces hirtus]
MGLSRRLVFLLFIRILALRLSANLSTRSASSSSSKIAAALRLKALASERKVPWGLHLWLALAYSDKMPKPQQRVFRCLRQERVLKRSSTDVFTYLFAHSLSSPIRLYTPPSALDLQSYFDTTLAPAARTVFLHTLLTASHHRYPFSPTLLTASSSLARAYLVDTVHLNTWRALGPTWWAVRMVMRRRFCCSDEEVESAWVVVTEVYEKVEEELRKQEQAQQRSHHHKKRKQPILVLFASRDDDSFASCLRLSVPPLSSLPKRVSTRIRILRATAAGQHAIRMYNASGAGAMAEWDRFARAMRERIIRGGPRSMSAMLVGAAVGVWYGVQGTLCEERARQLWFVCFG